MGIPSTGAVITFPFPFSDLTFAKVRPVVLLGPAGRGDWVLCQVTSKPYGDARAIELNQNDFATGGLRVRSYARPLKLLTAHESLFVDTVGKLHLSSLEKIVRALIAALETPL